MIHIEALQMLFPECTTEYLQGIRGNNITLQETIDKILVKSENIDRGGLYKCIYLEFSQTPVCYNM